MIMKKHLFAMVCMAVSLWSCSNDDAPVVGGPENGTAPAEYSRTATQNAN